MDQSRPPESYLPLRPGGALGHNWPAKLPHLAVACADSRSLWLLPARQHERPREGLSPKCSAARELALSLMAQHGLQDWSFGFNRSKRRMGLCIWYRDGHPGRIELSVHFCERATEAEVRETVLHELAHAKTPGDGHGPRWRAACIALGIEPIRCGDIEAGMPKGKWRATCQKCGSEFHLHRRPRCVYLCNFCGTDAARLQWALADED